MKFLLIARNGFLRENPCCVEEMKCIEISELNNNTVWNYIMQVTNDATDDDLSRSMIFKI